jgi:NAD-dependent deacetylase
MDEQTLRDVAEIIRDSKYCMAFTGAGVSVESGIPPFRGENSIWTKYNPIILDLTYFENYPEASWPVIKEIFYDFFGKAKPNKAHDFLARLEQSGIVKCVVTQNIDNLHQEAGSKSVYEFHGNSHHLVCMLCSDRQTVDEVDLSQLPLKCAKCGGLVKPDFIFFGERIPEEAYQKSMDAARKADVCLIIGSTGEVMPAAMIPREARRNGAVIIEINPQDSLFTREVTHIHLHGNAGAVCVALEKYLF